MRCCSGSWRWLCLYLNLPTSCWIIVKTYFVSVNWWISVWSRHPPPLLLSLPASQPENSRLRSVRVKRQRHLQAAELLPAGAQDALHAVVPVGQPVGQVDVGQVEDRHGQRVRALREEETRGRAQRSEALWVLWYHQITISASVEPVPSRSFLKKLACGYGCFMYLWLISYPGLMGNFIDDSLIY